MADEESEGSTTSSHSTLDWEDLVMDKTEVPVLLVFAILLLYIAFGGVLFSFLEDWTYMDAFYYCCECTGRVIELPHAGNCVLISLLAVISLTTIGFGDIVPINHEFVSSSPLTVPLQLHRPHARLSGRGSRGDHHVHR